MGHILPGKQYPLEYHRNLSWDLFNIFIRYLGEVTKVTVVIFADDTKLRGAVVMFKGRAATQRELYRLEEQANRHIMKFSKDK